MKINKLFKRSIALILALVMMMSLAACAKKPEESVHNEDEVTHVEENSEIVITDHLGRNVTLDKPAEKIVSGYFVTTSLMIALGLEDNVVGIEAKANSRPIYKLAAPQFLELPSVGTMKEFDVEGTVALKPDLVVLSVRLKDSIETLEKLGINVIAVNPESTEELIETIDMVAKATGSEERANKLKAYYTDKTEEIANLVEGADKKNVYLGGNSNFLSTASSKMYQHTLITNAGGENVAKDIDDTYWSTISYEQLLAYNPDVIIGVSGASYTKDDIINDENLIGVKAIENNEVYMMPDTLEMWDSPIPSGILGNLWLTSILHQEEYPFNNFIDDVYTFYNEFYEIEINKEDITK